MTTIKPSKAYLLNTPIYTGEFHPNGKAVTARPFPNLSSDKVTAEQLSKAGHVVGLLERRRFPWNDTAWALVDGVGYPFQIEG